MEPCYTLYHHGTKRSLDPAEDPEARWQKRGVGGWWATRSLFFSGERGTEKNIVPRLSHTWEKPSSSTTGSYYEPPLPITVTATKPAQSRSPALTCRA